MDDRHYLSTPRPVLEEDQPTWEVDVFRVGVDEPLLTLIINNTTLPPRCNKKKKVIWKLPDSATQIPSFGTEDKRRIWDLFKQQKKVRRKSSKLKTKPNTNDSQHSNTTNDSQKETPREVDTAANNHQQQVHNPDPQSKEIANDSLSNQSHTPTTTPFPTDTVNSPPPGFGNNADMVMRSDNTAATPKPPAATAPSRKTWKVTMTQQENAATALARMFIDTYYAMLHVGNATELYDYYCPGIQKSLSVGDAHHVCTTPEEVLLQLQSLAHPTWQLKGVVTQVGIYNSVVLLITGTVVLGNDTMSFCHSVTLVQVQEETNGSSEATVREYQIHNDAMAFLK